MCEFFLLEYFANCLRPSLHAAEKFAKNWTNSKNLLTLENSRAPTKSAIFCDFCKICEKIGEIAKFANKELGKNYQTSDFSQFSQIL